METQLTRRSCTTFGSCSDSLLLPLKCSQSSPPSQSKIFQILFTLPASTNHATVYMYILAPLPRCRTQPQKWLIIRPASRTARPSLTLSLSLSLRFLSLNQCSDNQTECRKTAQNNWGTTAHNNTPLVIYSFAMPARPMSPPVASLRSHSPLSSTDSQSEVTPRVTMQKRQR